MCSCLLLLLLNSAALAADQSSTSDSQAPAPESESNRLDHRLGAYLGILGDPHPTILGLNVAYNVTDFLRASAGAGQVSATSSLSIANDGSVSSQTQSMTTLGVAAKFLVPTWNLTPTASLGYSHISITDGSVFTDYKSNNLYVGIGGDWQAKSGFNLGAGMNISMNGAAPSAPYINVGYFF